MLLLRLGRIAALLLLRRAAKLLVDVVHTLAHLLEFFGIEPLQNRAGHRVGSAELPKAERACFKIDPNGGRAEIAHHAEHGHELSISKRLAFLHARAEQTARSNKDRLVHILHAARHLRDLHHVLAGLTHDEHLLLIHFDNAPKRVAHRATQGETRLNGRETKRGFKSSGGVGWRLFGHIGRRAIDPHVLDAE